MAATNRFRGVFRPRDLFFLKVQQILGLKIKKYRKKLSLPTCIAGSKTDVPPGGTYRGIGVGSWMNGPLRARSCKNEPKSADICSIVLIMDMLCVKKTPKKLRTLDPHFSLTNRSETLPSDKTTRNGVFLCFLNKCKRIVLFLTFHCCVHCNSEHCPLLRQSSMILVRSYRIALFSVLTFWTQ